MPDRGSSKIRTLELRTRTKCQVKQIKEFIDEAGSAMYLYKSQQENVFRADAGRYEGSQTVLSETVGTPTLIPHFHTRAVRGTITRYVSVGTQRHYSP